MSAINASDYELLAKMVLRRFGTSNEKLSRMNTCEKSLSVMDFMWYVKRTGNQISVSMSRMYNLMEEERPETTLVYVYNL